MAEDRDVPALRVGLRQSADVVGVAVADNDVVDRCRLKATPPKGADELAGHAFVLTPRAESSVDKHGPSRRPDEEAVVGDRQLPVRIRMLADHGRDLLGWGADEDDLGRDAVGAIAKEMDVDVADRDRARRHDQNRSHACWSAW